MAKLLQSPTIANDKLYTSTLSTEAHSADLDQTSTVLPPESEKFDKNVPVTPNHQPTEMSDVSQSDKVSASNQDDDEITILPTSTAPSSTSSDSSTGQSVVIAATNNTSMKPMSNKNDPATVAAVNNSVPIVPNNGLSSSEVGGILGALNSNMTKPVQPMTSSTPNSSSSSIITIDDDEDIVITQVIKPKQPVANNQAPVRPLVTNDTSLLKLATKIKSIVEPAASQQPKLKQLQQTLAALINSKTQGSQPSTSLPQSLPQQQQQQHIQQQQQIHQQQIQQQQRVQQRVQQQQIQQQQAQQRQQISSSNRSTQQHLQNLIQQALLQRTQQHAQSTQIQRNNAPQLKQQTQPNVNNAAAQLKQQTPANVNNAMHQLISNMLSKQQISGLHQKLNNGSNLLKNNSNVQQARHMHPSTSNTQNFVNNNQPRPSSSSNNNNNNNNNNNMSHLQNTLKLLQEQLKNKYSKETPESRTELSNIISNIMNLKNMRNLNNQQPGTSGINPGKLKSPSLLRQIQHAHRPKQKMQYRPNNQAHMQQQQRKAPIIDLSQNIPEVHHSKEKLQFLSVVGLITRQEHQKILLSHPARKRRLHQARFELEHSSTDSRKVRKRRKKDDADDDDTHDNYCSKCRMAGELLMCDRCPRVYHLFCVEPPLKQVPDGEWYCSKCKEEQEDMDVNVTDIMDDPGVDELSRSKIEELHRQLLEMKKVRHDLENAADVT